MTLPRSHSRSTAGRALTVAVLIAILAVGVVIVASSVRKVGAGTAVDDVPYPTHYVSDLAGIIDSQSKTKLLGYLQELEEKTGAQIVVLTVRTTGGVPIGDFAFKLAEKWQLGDKEKDNGALVVVAVDDREYWITVGDGLEGPLPDGFIGRVGRDYFVPNFRQGRYGQGLYDGMVVILTKLEAEYGVQLTGLPQAARPQGGSTPGTGQPVSEWGKFFPTIIVMGFVLMAILGRIFGGRSRGTWYYGGGSSRGSGGFGGGFGSFGGGGGGHFSGGGAGGRW